MYQITYSKWKLDHHFELIGQNGWGSNLAFRVQWKKSIIDRTKDKEGLSANLSLSVQQNIFANCNRLLWFGLRIQFDGRGDAARAAVLELRSIA